MMEVVKENEATLELLWQREMPSFPNVVLVGEVFKLATPRVIVGCCDGKIRLMKNDKVTNPHNQTYIYQSHTAHRMKESWRVKVPASRQWHSTT